MLTTRTRWIAVYLASALLPLAALAALSKEAFTQEFATVLRAAVPGHKVDIVEPLHLRITHPDGTDSTAYLDNAFKEYQSDPDARQELIERRVAAWVESIDSDGVPLDPKNIVPIIKDRGWVEEARTMSKARGFDPDESQVTEDYNDELVIVYAEDTPRNVRYFTSKDLAKAGVERSKLRALAIANLRRVLPKIEAHQGEVYSMYTADGNYEASLLLFDDLWDGDIRVDGDIVVAIPTRDVLLITGSKNAEGIARLREVADELTAEGTYTISPALFVYRKGKFRRFDP
ncbi:MAG TPA: DUF1444 family protein [Steroidobacteraceae bacterium]|jgi:uncharacterized protein YtpQ (UPF0354 family)|nr:DUF1444 family protein [Steroidobacteraceae bacterium]